MKPRITKAIIQKEYDLGEVNVHGSKVRASCKYSSVLQMDGKREIVNFNFPLSRKGLHEFRRYTLANGQTFQGAVTQQSTFQSNAEYRASVGVSEVRHMRHILFQSESALDFMMNHLEKVDSTGLNKARLKQIRQLPVYIQQVVLGKK